MKQINQEEESDDVASSSESESYSGISHSLSAYERELEDSKQESNHHNKSLSQNNLNNLLASPMINLLDVNSSAGG